MIYWIGHAYARALDFTSLTACLKHAANMYCFAVGYPDMKSWCNHLSSGKWPRCFKTWVTFSLCAQLQGSSQLTSDPGTSLSLHIAEIIRIENSDPFWIFMVRHDYHVFSFHKWDHNLRIIGILVHNCWHWFDDFTFSYLVVLFYHPSWTWW